MLDISQPIAMIQVSSLKSGETMNFEKILIDCIRYSEGISATSAAETIGVAQQTFGKWRTYKKTGRFPNPEHLVQISKLSGHDLQEVVAAYMAARCENAECKRAYEELAA